MTTAEGVLVLIGRSLKDDGEAAPVAAGRSLHLPQSAAD